MFSTFDLRLLLYVIRLAGWLKQCHLSLSLSLSLIQDHSVYVLIRAQNAAQGLATMID